MLYRNRPSKDMCTRTSKNRKLLYIIVLTDFVLNVKYIVLLSAIGPMALKVNLTVIVWLYSKFIHDKLIEELFKDIIQPWLFYKKPLQQFQFSFQCKGRKWVERFYSKREKLGASLKLLLNQTLILRSVQKVVRQHLLPNRVVCLLFRPNRI